MSTERKIGGWRVGVTVAATFIVMPLAYTLSYAPYMRLRFGPDPIRIDGVLYHPSDDPYWSQDSTVMYKPVEWLIDSTPAKEPLMGSGRV